MERVIRRHHVLAVGLLAGMVPWWPLRAEEAPPVELPKVAAELGPGMLEPDGALLEGEPDGSLWDLVPDEPLPGFDVPEDDESPLARQAVALAPSVVSLRAWDAKGRELASRCGVFIAKGGLVLTELGLLGSAGKPEYVSGMTGDGRAFRVTSVVYGDAQRGLLVVRVGIEGAPVVLVAKGSIPAAAAVRVMSLHPARGLTLADAQCRMDPTVAGGGSLELTGSDAPAAVGSPVLDAAGRVAGLVTHRLALRQWVGYAHVVTKSDADALEGRSGVPLGRYAVPDGGDPAKDPEFQQAFRLLAEKKVTAGARLLLRLTSRYPRSAAVWSLLGVSASALGVHRDAVACQRRAASLDPEISVYWTKLAEAERRGGSKSGTGAVAEVYQAAARQDPVNASAWLGSAEGFIREGEWQRAEDAARRAVALQSGSPRALRLLGYVLSRQGRNEEAAAALGECLKLDPADGAAAVLQAELAERAGRRDEAVQMLRRAAERNPRNAVVWRSYARLLRRAGRQGEATTAFERYLKIEQDAAGQ
jgi:Flp pilus assembly protein TadD